MIATNQASADTGATSIFIIEGADVDNKRIAKDPLTINLPNGKKVVSTHVCDINILGLPTMLTGGDLGVGFRGVVYAEIKLLHLFARPRLSTPHRQVFLLLCIPFVHGSYPATMYCCALSRVYESW